MPPKAEKKPTTAGKAPAGKAPAEKKEAGKKTAAPTGEKKKRSKTRKETYSSYIYKGMLSRIEAYGRVFVWLKVLLS
jgi:histone H2B